MVIGSTTKREPMVSHTTIATARKAPYSDAELNVAKERMTPLTFRAV